MSETYEIAFRDSAKPAADKGLASKSGNHGRTLENSGNAGPDEHTSY